MKHKRLSTTKVTLPTITKINAIEHIPILFVYLPSQKQLLYELFVLKIPLHNHFSLLFISQNSFPLSATSFYGFSRG